jgi:hypothetical protein
MLFLALAFAGVPGLLLGASLHWLSCFHTLHYGACALQVDFAHYKNVLKNQEIVSELEKTFTNFKPVDYDVNAQLKAIDSFQGKAVRWHVAGNASAS